jgi:hypothetical protein
VPSRQPDQASAHADLQSRLDGLDDLLEHRSRLAACLDRRPVTWYRLTAKGRKALLSHVDALARVIGHAGR